MSLIDDALKRARAAGQTEPGRPPGERPWTPAPLPDAGLVRRRTVIRWMGIALALALIGLAAVWSIRHEPSSALPLSAAAGRSEGRPLSVALAATQAPAAAPAEPGAATRPTARARPTPAAPLPGEIPAADAPETVATPAPAASRAPRAIVNGRSYEGAVALPEGGKIELGGIVWSETDPRALLNDRIVAIGAYVEGFTVSRIEEGRVALEKDGLTIFLTVK